mmetsp:Transcript_14052/g.16449  ORF Transcript_14052/g.16449 Transcript_14052/m.16449 type:complete len:279 (-) Transcript_14052:733-1569(-)
MSQESLKSKTCSEGDSKRDFSIFSLDLLSKLHTNSKPFPKIWVKTVFRHEDSGLENSVEGTEKSLLIVRVLPQSSSSIQELITNAMLDLQFCLLVTSKKQLFELRVTDDILSEHYHACGFEGLGLNEKMDMLVSTLTASNSQIYYKGEAESTVSLIFKYELSNDLKVIGHFDLQLVCKNVNPLTMSIICDFGYFSADNAMTLESMNTKKSKRRRQVHEGNTENSSSSFGKNEEEDSHESNPDEQRVSVSSSVVKRSRGRNILRARQNRVKRKANPFKQ